MREVTRPDPWQRFGWAVQLVWLVFLVFPIMVALEQPAPRSVVALALIAGFGVAYTASILAVNRREARGQPLHSMALVAIAVLFALKIGLWFVLGIPALGLVAFIVCFGMFTLDFAWATALAGLSVVGTGFSVIQWGGPEDVLIGVILLSVTVMTLVLRIVLDRSREAEQVREQLTIVDERERVARDVHDVLGHSLTVMSVKAELAERLLEVDPERARAELVEIQALSRSALAEIRSTVGGLRVARLEDELDAAHVALRGRGVECVVPHDATVVEPRHRLLFAWVLREAVTNVVRHSGASRCEVQLATNRIAVIDDGQGDGRLLEGNGLRGLRERVAAAGGRLAVDATPQGGTRVEVVV